MLYRAWLLVRLAVGWFYTFLCSIFASVGIICGQSVLTWKLFLKPWASGCLAILGIKLEVVGREHIQGPAVFVSNHQSTIDVVFVPGLLPNNTAFVAKKELLRVPFWGWMLGKTGILVDRKNPAAAIASIKVGVKQLRPGWSILVFPEGTRSMDGELLPFKKGAFHIAIETRFPLVPIAMDGAQDVMKKHHFLPRPGTIHVTVGKPIDTRHWKLETIEAHMQEVWTAMNECLRESQRRRAGRQSSLTHAHGAVSAEIRRDEIAAR
jgi:1-acyl-sn-glycerol-3-phosphate acyltransferase